MIFISLRCIAWHTTRHRTAWCWGASRLARNAPRRCCYLRFTRFEAKHFLLEATRFNDGSCPVCVIDNTSVLVVAGAGTDAVFAPEMVAFARTLGLRFGAHEVGDADRKGRIERQFSYIEKNFLAGRSFNDFEDLNRQALSWCRTIANQKIKRALGMSAEAAYLIEKPYLQPLPRVLHLFMRCWSASSISTATSQSRAIVTRCLRGTLGSR
jgi:hypothetical protein